jgi:cytohesin
MHGILLFNAARYGDTATVTTLLSSAGVQSLINTQDKDGYTPLYAAAANGHAPVTEQLIEARCDVELQETFGNTQLIIAAANGHEVVTKQLIAARCNVDLPDKDGYPSYSRP